MLLLSFKTCLQIVSKFLVQVKWKDSYHFSPVQSSFFNTMSWFWKLLEKKKPPKPRLSKRTGTICSDRGKHQGISAALLSIEVHSQLQTAHNLSRCSHGAVKTNNKKMVVEWDSFSWAKAHCIGEEQVPALGWGGPGAMAQPRLGSTEPWGLSPPSMLKHFGLKYLVCISCWNFASMPHLFNHHFP